MGRPQQRRRSNRRRLAPRLANEPGRGGRRDAASARRMRCSGRAGCDPVKRIMVNAGSAPRAPGCRWRPGKARCPLMGVGRGGVRVRSPRAGKPSTWRRRTAGPQPETPFGRSGVNTPAPLPASSWRRSGYWDGRPSCTAGQQRTRTSASAICSTSSATPRPFWSRGSG